MAKKNSTDTWQDLERRFHEIGNLPAVNTMLIFVEGKPGERIQWALQHGVEKGECHIKVIGGYPPPDQSPKYMGNEHFDGSEISSLMRRAGNLLIPHNPKNIWEGADLFVALTVKKQGYYVCTDGERKFFPNAGRTFGIMAGEMILEDAKSNTHSNDWPADKERDGRRILNNTPSMTVRTFCRELSIGDPMGGKLFHHIRGTTPRKRNRN